VANIVGLPTGITHYYARLTSIYSNSGVTFTGQGKPNTVGGTVRPVSFQGGQYVIDSTGKAGDVLKRIRVHRTPNNDDYRYPSYAINSVQEICKLLEVYPGGGTDGCTTP
jgi:hypothetical protein